MEANPIRRVRANSMRDWQYSLASLFLIAFWFALALGLVRLAISVYPYPVAWRVTAILAITSLGAGVGGLVRETRIVAAATFCIAAIPVGLRSVMEFALSQIDLP